jgi:hypothetical protein
LKIAILGCGPAGLLIAHAARLSGHQPIIFSKKQISPMRGAQYQHVPIPGLPQLKPQLLRYTLLGSMNAYRERVYGARDPDIRVSPEDFDGVQKIWDLRHTYRLLWNSLHASIIDRRVSSHLISNLLGAFDHVFSTIPAPLLCELQNIPGEIAVRDHDFKFVNAWIDSCWQGPLPGEDDLWRDVQHLVVCNGLPLNNYRNINWYRTSHIFNNVNTEWSTLDGMPDNYKVPGKLASIRKPVSNTCTCWPTVIRAGRYGSWTKGVLTHNAFQEAMDILASNRNQLQPLM